MADSSKDFAKMKVADLKRELKIRGLSTVGNKQELQERLLNATSDQADSSLLLLEDGPVADAEDILNEDEVLADDDDDADADDDAELEATTPDDGCASSSKRLLEDSEEELDSGVTSSPGAKQGTTSTQVSTTKKIILNRKGPVAVPVPSPGKENVAVSKPEESSDKNIIKLSAVSMEKRLELRAAKFGPPTSETAKKEARVARFGLSSSTPAPATPSSGSTVNSELLKKRAERFGLVAGSVSEKAELEEKKQKRLERFGASSSKPAADTNGSTVTKGTGTVVSAATPASNKIPITAPTSSDASLVEKKRLRAERFRMTAK